MDTTTWNELSKKAAQVFIDYGVLGIIVAVFGSPFVYFLWQLVKVASAKLPTIFDRLIVFLENAIALQGTTAQAVKENTEATGRISATMDVAAKQLASITPRPGHPYSTAELEEFALVALRGFRSEYVDQQTDPAVKERLNDLCDEARDIFTRKLRESR